MVFFGHWDPLCQAQDTRVSNGCRVKCYSCRWRKEKPGFAIDVPNENSVRRSKALLCVVCGVVCVVVCACICVCCDVSVCMWCVHVFVCAVVCVYVYGMCRYLCVLWCVCVYVCGVCMCLWSPWPSGTFKLKHLWSLNAVPVWFPTTNFAYIRYICAITALETTSFPTSIVIRCYELCSSWISKINFKN